MFKVQSQAVTIILIAGIVIALVGAAYVWGIPLIDKRTTITEISSTESFIEQLDKKITSIANRGSGKETMDIPGKRVLVIPYDPADPYNTSKNSIIMEFIVKQPTLFEDSTIYLGATNFDVGSSVGAYPDASPSLVTLTQKKLTHGVYRMRIKLHYREIDTQTAPRRGYRIVFNEGGDVFSAKNKLSISWNKKEERPNDAKNTGDLVLTHLSITDA